jgi:hypothetical protein
LEILIVISDESDDDSHEPRSGCRFSENTKESKSHPRDQFSRSLDVKLGRSSFKGNPSCKGLFHDAEKMGTIEALVYDKRLGRLRKLRIIHHTDLRMDEIQVFACCKKGKKHLNLSNVIRGFKDIEGTDKERSAAAARD